MGQSHRDADDDDDDEEVPLSVWEESLTVVWDDEPGHGGGVDASDHPEHAQPAQVLASLLPSQHLGEVGEHDRHGSADPAGERGGGAEGRLS